MDFSKALKKLRKGHRVTRPGWNGKGMWLALIESWRPLPMVGLSYDTPCAPFIAMKTADNKLVPWLASQTDLLADDWIKILPAAVPLGHTVDDDR